jgi:hypothetical protein
VACIFAALSDREQARTKEYQALLLDQLRRALELWNKGGKTEPNEIHLIEVESAFSDALRQLPEFRKLLEVD